MKHILFALSLGFLGLILATQHAFAQSPQQCGPRDAVVERLATGYGENRRSLGLAANNAVIEVFASAETGSWTITVTLPNGLMCLLASGQDFEAVNDRLPAKGKDS
jgi:hypothetical protein